MGRMKKEYTAFNKNLKAYRKKEGYTVNEFAEILGMPPNTYYAYEIKDREPSFSILLKIANALHVTTDELLNNELAIKCCPFCGSDVTEVMNHWACNDEGEVYQVTCNACDACGPQEKSKQQAIRRWNELKR